MNSIDNNFWQSSTGHWLTSDGSCIMSTFDGEFFIFVLNGLLCTIPINYYLDENEQSIIELDVESASDFETSNGIVPQTPESRSEISQAIAEFAKHSNVKLVLVKTV